MVERKEMAFTKQESKKHRKTEAHGKEEDGEEDDAGE